MQAQRTNTQNRFHRSPIIRKHDAAENSHLVPRTVIEDLKEQPTLLYSVHKAGGANGYADSVQF
jgi:hypothetical protein